MEVFGSFSTFDSVQPCSFQIHQITVDSGLWYVMVLFCITEFDIDNVVCCTIGYFYLVTLLGQVLLWSLRSEVSISSRW